MKRQHILLPAIVISLFLLQLTFAALPRYEITDLGTYDGGWSVPCSVNNNGQVVGWAVTNSFLLHATFFDTTGSGNNIDLGTLGGSRSCALYINDNGQVVGFAENRAGHERATLFDPTGNGDNIDLGTLGGDESVAISNNDSGQIVGDGVTTSGHLHATLFDPTGRGNNIDLGTLGGVFSSARSINDTGQIVGEATDTYCDMHATLFDPTGNGNNINLNTLINLDRGWYLANAISINNHGWIVGAGDNPAGEYHAYLLIPKPPRTYYVDDNATGNNDGSSWADAFNYLQDALTVAWSGDEIWVAQGIYTPDSNSADPNGSGDREATFQLINGVTLKGGYAGEGTPDPNARDIQLYETILTGDLNGNDGPNFTHNDDNSYHVVTGSGTDETAVLDGFTITGGNADGSYPNNCGGGMYNYRCSPTVANCTLRGNAARSDGGGMYCTFSSPMLINCRFLKNSAEYGGGMLNDNNSSPTVRNCTFSENSTGYTGGGMHNWNSSPIVTCCTFSSNSTMHAGGGMYTVQGEPNLTNCTFIANTAPNGGGGGMFNSTSSPTLTNCTFSGNSANYGGGITSGVETHTAIANCILWGNTAASGNDVVLGGSHGVSTATISYSNIKGGLAEVLVDSGCTLDWGEGNINANPRFVSPGYWDANGLWIDGDYHLLEGSPCIDAGDPNYVAEPNETDLDGRPRVIGGRIDMGAYESPLQAEARIVPRSINLTSKGKWITCYLWLSEGYNVADIDPNSVLLEGEIKPEEFSVDQQKQVAVLRFSREDVQPILEVGDIDLTIIGRLTDGTAFDAADTIKVIDKARKK